MVSEHIVEPLKEAKARQLLIIYLLMAFPLIQVGHITAFLTCLKHRLCVFSSLHLHAPASGVLKVDVHARARVSHFLEDKPKVNPWVSPRLRLD